MKTGHTNVKAMKIASNLSPVSNSMLNKKNLPLSTMLYIQ